MKVRKNTFTDEDVKRLKERCDRAGMEERMVECSPDQLDAFIARSEAAEAERDRLRHENKRLATLLEISELTRKAVGG